uniref:Uncharacterized protein n=1 Tax=viral metagenome TaxID=1070528 RepID=A0A6M3J255_9ZZZZ
MGVITAKLFQNVGKKQPKQKNTFNGEESIIECYKSKKEIEAIKAKLKPKVKVH